MPSKNEQQSWTDEMRARLYADLDRFMQCDSLRSARDIVIEDPLLLGDHVMNWLSESAKRLRQMGNVDLAEASEIRLHVLRTFREFGPQDGYLELVVGDLVRAKTAEDYRRIRLENPGLNDDATLKFITRRIAESLAVADSTAADKYKFAGVMLRVAEVDDPNPLDVTAAVNTFLLRFVHEQDPGAQRRFLESRPDLLQPPLSMLVSSILQPYIDQARASNDLPKLKIFLKRQELFDRCQKVGIARAFQELAAK